MKRTLFITSNRLGDAVLTTGVLHHLIKMEPNVPVTVVCGHLPAEIFRAIKGVEKVVAISKRKNSLHWWDAFKEIDHFFWHKIVDYRGSPLGFLPTRHRHLWRGSVEHQHKVEANARTIGYDQPLPPKIICDALTGDLLDRLPKKEKILAIAPTANFPGKQWHFENYLNLAKILTKADGILPGAKVVVLGAPGEEAQAMPVVDNLPKSQVLGFVGQTSPMQAAEIISRCELFVGNDSGLMHTSVAVGTPTVGLFGIGKPIVYGPWGEKSLCLVGTPAGVEITRQIEYDADGATYNRETLPVEHVAREVQAFYRNLQ